MPQPKLCQNKRGFTTKDTKFTKFKSINIQTLRGLRDLRGEICSYRITNPPSVCRKICASRENSEGKSCKGPKKDFQSGVFMAIHAVNEKDVEMAKSGRGYTKWLHVSKGESSTEMMN